MLILGKRCSAQGTHQGSDGTLRCSRWLACSRYITHVHSYAIACLQRLPDVSVNLVVVELSGRLISDLVRHRYSKMFTK